MKWTFDAIEYLGARRRLGVPFPDIARALGVTEAACRTQYSLRFSNNVRKSGRFVDRFGNSSGHVAGVEPKVSQLADLRRAKMAEAREHQSLTGQVFGDPPPGFSALDRRRA